MSFFISSSASSIENVVRILPFQFGKGHMYEHYIGEITERRADHRAAHRAAALRGFLSIQTISTDDCQEFLGAALLWVINLIMRITCTCS